MQQVLHKEISAHKRVLRKARARLAQHAPCPGPVLRAAEGDAASLREGHVRESGL